MNCPCCNGLSTPVFIKGNYEYYQCKTCQTLYVPGGIDQSNMVGGGFEAERNTSQNSERIRRFSWLSGIYGSILDYGCGHGMLVNDVKLAGMDCDGYDKFNPDMPKVPNKKYNLVSMIEVIEHLYSPYSELNEIREVLADNGIVYIETSFTDIIPKPFDEAYYVEPSVGHCTIFSHMGLDILMTSKGFTPLEHLNGNVRLYQKSKA